MAEEKSPGDDIRAQITGDVSGQVAIGKGITQTQSIGVPAGQVSSAELEELTKLVPQLSRVVLLGLCDGASAALMYAHGDPRIAGVVMLNPWVRATGSLEQARVRGYYPARAISAGFWKY